MGNTERMSAFLEEVRRCTVALSLSQATCLGHWYDVRLDWYCVASHPGEVPKDLLRSEVGPPFVIILAQDTQRVGVKGIFAVGRSSKVGPPIDAPNSFQIL